MTLKAWAPGWGDIGSPNTQSTKCTTFYTIWVSGFKALVWDQGPTECPTRTVPNTPPYNPITNPQYGSHAVWPSNTWYCRNGRDPGTDPSNPPTSPGCPDGNHRWTACGGDIFWTWGFDNGVSGPATCRVSASAFYGQFYSGSFFGNFGTQFIGPDRWGNFGSPYPFSVTCDGPSGSATATWN
jgi:hypothetical protein